MKQYSARFPSTLASVAHARRACTEFAQSCGFGPSETADIALAVGEACNNAAEHGHIAGGQYCVRCTFANGALRICVEDRGKGFEPRGKGARREPEQRGVRGLGIFIMRALMDDVSYEITDVGTAVSLIKRRSKAAARHRSGTGIALRGLSFVGTDEFMAVRPLFLR